MIDYYLLDFLVGLGQVVSVILMCIFFFCYMLLERYRKKFLLLAGICTVINFAILVFSAAWPHIL